MKTPTSFTLAACICLSASNLLAQVVVFEADFDSSTEVSILVTANATKSNLDAGTSVGSWTTDASAPGAIISNAANTDNAFVFDKATSGLITNSVMANFSQAVDLNSKTMSLEMDLYAARQSGNQAVVFSVGDATDDLFEFTFKMNSNKQFTALGFVGTSTTTNATGVNNGFNNPAVDDYLTWGSATMIRVKLDISSSSVAELSIDWNDDGDYADDGEWLEINIEPQSDLVNTISSLTISNLDSVNGGAWIDNIVVTSQDKPRYSFNLARYQSTNVDSKLTSSPGQYATDGFVTQDSRWDSDSTGPHWLEVELAVPMEIGSAHLYAGGSWDGSAISDAVMQYHDGNGWVDISGTSLTGNTSTIVNLEFTSSITAQRFRLYTTDAEARVAELALYAPTESGAPVPFGTDVDLNFAKLRQYEYSSVAGTNYPKLAIDGHAHNGSVWASANTAGPHDLEVHFPVTEKVGEIHLYSGYEGQSGTQIEDFELAYDDGGSWVVFSGGAVTGNTELERTIVLPSSVNTKKIRLRSLDSTQAIVRELVVLPPLAGGSFPLWTDAKDEMPSTKSFLDYEDSYHTIENRAAGTNLSTTDTGAVLAGATRYQVLLNIGTDDYRIRSKSTEKCFEVSLASSADGAAIMEGTYSSMPHQRWELQPVDNTHFRIVNVWSGLVLGNDNGDIVQQTSNGSTSQQWLINYEKHYPKQGQASHLHFNWMFRPGWAYNWGSGDENLVSVGQYMPMQWGGMAAANPGILRNQPNWYSRANQTTLLGFNEPDLHDQANMTEDTAAYQWPRLERTQLPLVGPAPANYQGAWRQAYEALAEDRGHRSEYMAMHWYSTAGAASGSPSTLINNMQSLYNTYGKPIWLTEFSTRDFVGDKTTWSRNHNFNFLAEFIWRAESLPWLKSWSPFEWSIFGGDPNTTDASSADPTDMNSPRMALHYNNDLTDPGWEDLAECGLLLAGWDGNASVVNDTSYIIHNKARFLRLIDDPSSSTVTTADVLNRIATEQFMLQAGPSGKKYIVGLSDGRRLSYNGSSVGLAAAGTTGTAVEWQLNEHEYGWFYINHPSTGRRLRINNSDGIDTVANSTANDNVRFRFIKHYLPVTLAEVQTVPYAESFENGVGAWRQFYADDYDWEVGSGGTPTAAAGPSGASDGEFYLFAEGHDSGAQGDITQVECAFDFSTVNDPKLRFDYHMYGTNIDYLAVDIHDGSTWTNDVWLRTNQQHTSSEDRWTRAVVDLTAYAGTPKVTIRFRTSRKVWNAADPAIDNIRISEPETLPYAESFENGLGAWNNAPDDDYNWTLNSGDTPTGSAGPSAASDGAFYLYAEGHDSPSANAVTHVEAIFDFSTASGVELTFDYHMNGFYIDYLAVDIHDGTTWTNDVWRVDGQQMNQTTDPWLNAVINLSAYVGNSEVTIRFRTATTEFNSADPAIDNISLIEVANTLPYMESFETGFGSWSQVQDDDIDWTRHTGGTPTANTGPSQASDGTYYIYFEGHDSGVKYKSASIENTFDLSTATNPGLSFDYHMYGQYIDYLAVDIHDGTSWITDVWIQSPPQQTASTDPWLTATLDLSSYIGLSNVTIRFRAQQEEWHAADMAVDNIIIDEVVDTPYSLWADTAFAGAPPETDTTESGNPDGDDYTNVEEWLLVLDPLTPDSPVLTHLQTPTDFVVYYDQRDVGNPYVRAAWTETLLPGSWRYHGDGLTESWIETNGDIESMSATVPMSPTKKFIRLEVWYLPE
ncbi:MAG: glycosyl hydrolase [Opitutaceae bacterium]